MVRWNGINVCFDDKAGGSEFLTLSLGDTSAENQWEMVFGREERVDPLPNFLYAMAT